MNTRVLLNHEPVADGGFVARAVLLIEGPMADCLPSAPGVDHEGSVPPREPAFAAATRLSAQNVHVAVRPGRDAEYIQMRHTFDSEGAGDVLTIVVGDVYALDRIRIRLDALVGPGAAETHEVDVGQLVVLAHLRTDRGLELQTIRLPIRLSPARGGSVHAEVCSMPISAPSQRGGPKTYTFRSLGGADRP